MPIFTRYLKITKVILTASNQIGPIGGMNRLALWPRSEVQTRHLVMLLIRVCENCRLRELKTFWRCLETFSAKLPYLFPYFSCLNTRSNMTGSCHSYS